MVKKKKDGEIRQKQIGLPDSDLDRGYCTPIKTTQDVTFENIKLVLINSRYAQILFFLTIMGMILRFYNLGYNSLWLDEAVTYETSIKAFGEIWTTISSGDFNPPLFYWIEHFMLFFGNSEFILRFIPAVLGVLSIPLFYCIGKELLDRELLHKYLRRECCPESQ